MYFRIQEEENYIFMFSDVVLCFEMKTYSTVINMKIYGLNGWEEFIHYVGIVHVPAFPFSVSTDNWMR